jgi:hypothetical protein
VEPVLAVRRRRRDDDAEPVGERREHDVPRVAVRDERGLVNPEDVEAGTTQRLRIVGRAELDRGEQLLAGAVELEDLLGLVVLVVPGP